MTGLTSLDEILAQLEPRLAPQSYVYCSVPDPADILAAGMQPFALVREREGVTLVLEATDAGALGMDTTRLFRRISLGVHSSLAATGLTAVASQALTDAGISANVIAGYFHDHFMVPASRAQEALAALRRLSEAAGEA